jgi:hypothetical protein
MKNIGECVSRLKGERFLAPLANFSRSWADRLLIHCAVTVLVAAPLFLPVLSYAQGDTLILRGICGEVSYANAVTAYNKSAFVADLSNGISVIDFSDPTIPTEITEYPGLVFDIEGDRNLTYQVGLGLTITDVSNPTEPEQVASCCNVGQSLNRVHLFDNLALTARRSFTGDLSLFIIDVTDPSSPETLATTWPDSPTIQADVFKKDHYAFWVDRILDAELIEKGRIVVFDISDPTAPEKIVTDTCLEAAPSAIWIKDDYAYVAENYAGRGLMVFDVSDPYDIDSAGCFTIPGGRPWNVCVKGSYAYVCAHMNPPEEYNRIYVLDISNPMTPSLVAYHDTPGTPYEVFVDDPYVLVADYGSLVIFEASFLDLPGDVNQDGIVNVGDVVLLVNFLYKGGVPPESMEAGDVNGDCIVNVGDIVYLINYLYRNGPAPLAGCVS